MTKALLTIPAPQARRLLLDLAGLAAPPRRRQSDDDLMALIERLGFVQLDSVNVVERAHHMILFARNQTYRPAQLRRLTEDAGVTVLLLEAGPWDRSIILEMPAALSLPLQNDRFNWDYKSEPEPYMDGRAMNCPRGRVGSSNEILDPRRRYFHCCGLSLADRQRAKYTESNVRISALTSRAPRRSVSCSAVSVAKSERTAL